MALLVLDDSVDTEVRESQRRRQRLTMRRLPDPRRAGDDDIWLGPHIDCVYGFPICV